MTVSGLPVNGSIIYIRLWSLLPTGWFFADTSVLAAAQGMSTGNLVLVKEKLKEMNELLQKAIDDYRNDVIEEDELRKRIDEIIKLKLEAIDGFPDVWGIPFADWYRWFANSDSNLDFAKRLSDDWMVPESFVLRLLENAKGWKEFAEQNLDGVLID